MKTLADFYNYAVALMKKRRVYFGHGTDNAEDEAWWLIASILKLPIDQEIPEKMLTATELKALQQVLQKRVEDRIPLAYLLREAYQYGHKFYVDERVLIPRSPIAELIKNQFQPWIEAHRVKRILDLCTGSGCLAVLAALAFPKAHVDATDLSFDALEVAARNKVPAMRLIESDVFSALQGQKYDIILSNPPYVDARDLKEMPAEYHHEPRMALAAGEDGLDIVHRILKEAKAHLNPGGILVVEVSNSEDALVKAYPHLPFVWLDFEYGGHGVFLLKREDL